VRQTLLIFSFLLTVDGISPWVPYTKDKKQAFWGVFFARPTHRQDLRPSALFPRARIFLERGFPFSSAVAITATKKHLDPMRPGHWMPRTPSQGRRSMPLCFFSRNNPRG